MKYLKLARSKKPLHRPAVSLYYISKTLKFVSLLVGPSLAKPIKVMVSVAGAPQTINLQHKGKYYLQCLAIN